MPAPTHIPLLTDSYLDSIWFAEYHRYLADEDNALRERLVNWSARLKQKETADSDGLTSVFFKGIWGYRSSGETAASEPFTLRPQREIAGAGQRGGTG